MSNDEIIADMRNERANLIQEISKLRKRISGLEKSNDFLGGRPNMIELIEELTDARAALRMRTASQLKTIEDLNHELGWRRERDDWQTEEEIGGETVRQPAYFTYGNQRYQEGYDEAEQESAALVKTLREQVDRIGTNFHAYVTPTKTLFVSDDVRAELIDRGDKIKALREQVDATPASMLRKDRDLLAEDNRKVRANLDRVREQCDEYSAATARMVTEKADMIDRLQRVREELDAAERLIRAAARNYKQP